LGRFLELYAVVNQLHRSAALNGGEALSKPPYFLIEVKALAPDCLGGDSSVGRLVQDGLANRQDLLSQPAMSGVFLP
jgi:hypothetical protein